MIQNSDGPQIGEFTIGVFSRIAVTGLSCVHILESRIEGMLCAPHLLRVNLVLYLRSL